MDNEMNRINQGSIPTFDGSAGKYSMWWTKFTAFAAINGLSEVIRSDPSPYLPESCFADIDSSDDDGKRRFQTKKLNDLAMSCFTMAFMKEGIMRLVSKAKTKEWPDGLAYLVVRELNKKYKPRDILSRVEMRQRLNQVQMKKGSDPAVLFETLAAIEDQYDGVGMIDESDLIAIVLDVATDDYQAVLTAEQSSKGEDLTLNDLEMVMNQHYRQLNRRKNMKKINDDGEMLLIGANVTCYNCGKNGHMANKCPAQEKTNGSKDDKRTSKKCLNCNMKGHLAKDCWFKESNKEKRPPNFKIKESKRNGEEAAVTIDNNNNNNINLQEYLLGTTDNEDMMNDPDIWIADTAATVHMTSHRQGLVNLRKVNDGDNITMGNGTQEKIEEIADVIGSVKIGTSNISVRIHDVTIIKNGRFNLFSLSQMLSKGWEMTGSDDNITIKKGHQKISFNEKIYTKKGVLFGIRIIRGGEFCGGTHDVNPVTMTVQQAHNKLGHISFEKTKKIAKQMGWILTNNVTICYACAEAKARQKNIKHTNQMSLIDEKEKNAGRVHIDISSVQNNESAEVESTYKPYWRIMVDERTQMKFSDFFVTKRGMIEPTCKLIYTLKEAGKNINIIRCDDGGENKALEQRINSSDWKLNVKFEYTGRDTPQRNSLAEVAFHTLASRGRAIMNAANIPKALKFLLWREAFQTVTLLDNLTVITINGKENTRYGHWENENPKYLKYLRTWGEAGVVKLRDRNYTKLDDRGYTCMFVGYSQSHSSDTYRMWDPRSKRVHITRDIRWLKKMYFQELSIVQHNFSIDDITDPKSNIRIDDDSQHTNGNSDESLSENDNLDNESQGNNYEDYDEHGNNENDNNDCGEENLRTTRSGRIVRPPSRFKEFTTIGTDGYYENALAGVIEDEIISTEEYHVMNYNRAMSSKDRQKWIHAVKEEHDRMVNANVWTAVDRHEINDSDKILTTTWAMKKKPNGTFRARINARGFEQIDGLHYNSSNTAAPVTNDTTIRIIFTLAVLADWKGYLIDVKGAFLNGRLDDEKLYLKIPQGFEEYYSSTKVLRLNRAIYGLKQAAQAFWKELLTALNKMGFKRSYGDPCCYVKTNRDRLVVCLSWVDDCIFFGTNEDVIAEKNKMMSYFSCDDIGFVKEYVGCQISMNSNDKTVKFTQPILIQSLIDEFGAGDKQVSTPATAGQTLQAGAPEDEINVKEKRKYQAGVGKLLYLARWSRPEIGNAVRELSKFASRPMIGHVDAMHRVMNYCVVDKELGWTLKPEGKWSGSISGPEDDNIVEISGVSDSDYSKDMETRRSVTGYSVFLNGAPIAAKSKMQEAVTLSVTEAELVAATHCFQEMLYVKKVVESIGIKVKMPMTLKVDNKGAKDFINSWSVGGRTRHIDVRYLFLREAKEKNLVKIEWISSKINPSDLFTKNLNNELFKRHSTEFVRNDDVVKCKFREGVRIN
jgi:Reverse transcriptase (RNA-dependent DNA polymerase)/Zinc knuckle